MKHKENPESRAWKDKETSVLSSSCMKKKENENWRISLILERLAQHTCYSLNQQCQRGKTLDSDLFLPLTHEVQYYIVKYKNWQGSEGCAEQHCVYGELDRAEIFQALDLMDNLFKNRIAFCWPVLWVVFWMYFISDISYWFRTHKYHIFSAMVAAGEFL